MSDIAVAGMGAADFDGVVYMREDVFLFKITKGEQEIYVSEPIYKTSREALEALEAKLVKLSGV